MAKRKAGVNDIIYELDNDDIELSSEDESNQPKKRHSDIDFVSKSPKKTELNNDSLLQSNIINVSDDKNSVNQSNCNGSNGGKSVDSDCKQNIISKFDDNNLSDSDVCKKNIDDSNITLYNEDMHIDSPSSNTDLGVVGCENRAPLVTLRFKDSQLANSYKKKIKEFMLRLIKLHDEEHLDASDADTDVELDIWPEDLIENENETEQSIPEEDNFFFVDTVPCDEIQTEIPKYSQVSSVICNSPEKKVETPEVQRRGPTCFNCDGAHALKDCPLPKDHAKIAKKRKNMPVRMGRYHVEDDQKYGHLVPGRISGELRHALGLKRNELPMYIYRMRMLGYPPGWLEEARISHSGITMFDSTGSAIMDPEDEEGECYEPGSKDKFDIKKILDFPGFNVPASSRYIEEGHMYGIPPISEQDSKMAMLQTLAPNAMKAYKRKKLAFFPSADRSSLQGQAEMELDSGDEVPEFPSVPPLPDEAPPPPPPPPASSPPPEPLSSTPKGSPRGTPDASSSIITIDDENNSQSDLEITDVMRVMDIPIPEEDLITIDEDNSTLDSSHEDSLTLDDLEKKKMLLLNALDGNISELESFSIVEESKETETSKPDDAETKQEDKGEDTVEVKETSKPDEMDIVGSKPDEMDIFESKPDEMDIVGSKPDEMDIVGSKPDESKRKSEVDLKTPDSKAGHVKTTLYGTPVVNSSPYSKLPSDEKFAKDICDVINFENLPNSTGKYKKICSLLKKVKTEVDRIQDS